MRTAYFDCFSGISGDMVLGALIDAGCDLRQIEAELRRLPISGWKISAEKVSRGGLAATRVLVETFRTPPTSISFDDPGLNSTGWPATSCDRARL